MVFTYKLLLWTIVLMGITSHSMAFDMQQYYQLNNQSSYHLFLHHFPYNNYLKTVAFTDFKTLQKDRLFLYDKFGDGDKFLYYLGENFIKNYPVTLNQLPQKISIGEAFITPKNGVNTATNEIYQIIGYFILGNVARKIETAVKNKQFDASTPTNQKILDRLAKQKIYVSIEKSTITKIINHVQKGNWQYILNRIVLKTVGFYQPLCQFIDTYFNYASWVLFGGIGLLFIMSSYTRIMALLLILIVSAVSFLLPKPQITGATNAAIQCNPKFKLKFASNHAPISRNEHAMNLLNIVDIASKKQIGQTVWLQRPNIKAHYFAFQNVAQKYQNFKKNNKVVLATTGGFTNSHRKPEGLTVENGNIVNAVIMHDRHGLVIVQKTGGIRVLNLKRSSFDLPIGPNKVKKIDTPLNSLVAYSELLEWCKNTKATLFQTQLLAYSNKLLIKPSKAPPQLRERRILTLFSDTKNEQVHHAIFNIEASYNLAEIAHDIFCIVESRNKKIEAILNLDVGSYNILEVFDDNSKCILRGTVLANQATNLIVYTQ